MVDDDKMILRLATEALKDYAEGFNVRTALDGRQALQILNSVAVDLVLTDLKMPTMDGYELLSFMSRVHKTIPIIVMTGYGSPDIAKHLKEKGVFHYIEKPFEINVLREKVANVFSETSKGSIRGFTLANFLQAVEMEQKTSTLKITSKHRVGYLHIENGDLIDARTDDKTGEDAALEILCWDNAGIQMQAFSGKKKTIENALMSILLEAAKIKDDNEEDSDNPLDEAIRLAEGHHYRKAQEIMTVFLKENRQNAQGWFWFSRIIVTMKSIGTSLRNASKLDPESEEIKEEIKKFNIARQSISVDQVRRCPFCWAPVDLKVFECAYCRSHLYIHDTFFQQVGKANPNILEKAIERYTKVIGREQNITAHYYLSVAHLNLHHWEQALNLFNKTVKLAPEKKIFSEQLKKLLNYMASEEPSQEIQAAATGNELNTSIDATAEPEKKIPKILVVEDSSTTRKVITITLGQRGYDIIEARDGLEAFSKLNEEPDLILLDIILPNMDGYKILEFIRKNPKFKSIPVIMLTSKGGMVNKWKGKILGATAYLTKPFDPKVLVETIERHL